MLFASSLTIQSENSIKELTLPPFFLSVLFYQRNLISTWNIEGEVRGMVECAGQAGR
jgi:hypothetical protein